ncbi:MAG TPA: lamin tail domain-containing protein [Capillimicrobium sp.]|nr:lamin tail domain-containing protein [Capillimicrobium sp.]
MTTTSTTIGRARPGAARTTSTRHLLAALGAVTALLCALAAAVPAPADAARRGHCIGQSGPRCHFWKGKVTFVADGDTIDVDIRGDRRGPRRVRLTGINAPELRRYSHTRSRRRGQCHGVSATNRLEDLIRAGHWRVRLAAQRPSSHSGHRLRRQVSVRLNGAWVDTGLVQVGEGRALWLPGHPESAWNDLYRRAAIAASNARAGMYGVPACRPPAPSAQLELGLRWDAPHADADHVRGEWIRVRNRSLFPVRLGGWWVRDAALRRFRFPRGTVVPPGGQVTVRVGRGHRHGHTFFWGLRRPAFENKGDGGYLFDRHANLRAWHIYPNP